MLLSRTELTWAESSLALNTLSLTHSTFTRAHIALLFSLINPERKQLTGSTLCSRAATKHMHLWLHFKMDSMTLLKKRNRDRKSGRKTEGDNGENKTLILMTFSSTFSALCKNPVVSGEDPGNSPPPSSSLHRPSQTPCTPQDQTPPASGSHILMNAEGEETQKRTHTWHKTAQIDWA